VTEMNAQLVFEKSPQKN